MSYYSSNSHEYSGYYYNHHQPFFSDSTFDSYNTPQYNYYYPPPPPPPSSYPISYDHNNYASCYYNQTHHQPVLSYSAYHPHYVSYNSIVQDPASTQFVISYSTAAEPAYDTEFEEYDPTPYDGGYDIDLAYGKPLPASDQTCYPRSSFDPNAPKADGISVNGIVAPYGGKVVVEDEIKHGGKEEAGSGVKEEVLAVVPEQQRQDEGGFTSGDETEEEETQDEKGVSESIGIGGSAPVQDSGFDDRGARYGNGNGGYGEKVRQIAPGYGLEATDICESLFGYWPCWARRNQSGFGTDDGSDYNEVVRDSSTGYDYGIDGSYCKGTVDYLFGNPNPYGGTVDDVGNYGNPLYCYAYQRGFQQHHLYQQQHQYQQVEYGDADCEGYSSGGGYYS